MANLPCFSALITFPHHLNANWGFDSLPVLNPQTLSVLKSEFNV